MTAKTQKLKSAFSEADAILKREESELASAGDAQVQLRSGLDGLIEAEVSSAARQRLGIGSAEEAKKARLALTTARKNFGESERMIDILVKSVQLAQQRRDEALFTYRESLEAEYRNQQRALLPRLAELLAEISGINTELRKVESAAGRDGITLEALAHEDVLFLRNRLPGAVQYAGHTIGELQQKIESLTEQEKVSNHE